MQKGDMIYWARIIPNIGYAEIFDLKIRTVQDDWCVGTDKTTKQAYFFKQSSPVIFTERKDALDYLNKHKVDRVQLTSGYEEY